jgi:PAS domain-containing protein
MAATSLVCFGLIALAVGIAVWNAERIAGAAESSAILQAFLVSGVVLAISLVFGSVARRREGRARVAADLRRGGLVLLTVDREGLVQRVNRSVLGILGGRFDDWIGKPLLEFPDAQPWRAIKALVTDVFADGRPLTSQVEDGRIWKPLGS